MRSHEDVVRFLADKPREWAEVLAARAALRVVPLFESNFAAVPSPLLYKSFDVFLTLLRAAVLPWLAAVVPARGQELRNVGSNLHSEADSVAAQMYARSMAAISAATAAVDATRAASLAIAGANYAAADAVEDAASAASAADAARAAAYEAANAGARAAYAESTANAAANRRAAYSMFSQDAADIAERDKVSVLRVVPLWRMINVSERISAGWITLSATLRRTERGDDWNLVWIDWYEAIRDGRAPWGLPREVGEQILVEAMLWPQSEWGKGALHINRRIAVLIEAARAGDSPPPEPDPGPGPVLAVTPRGFETVATPPTLSERTDPMQISLHQAVLRRIRRLDPEIVRVLNTHRLLHAEYVDYASFVSNDLADVDVPTIWSTGAALVDMIGKLEGRYERATASGRIADLDELPDETILANLTQLARDHAAFVMGFAQARDLAARAATLRQLGGNPEEQRRRAKAVLAPMLSAAGLLAERARRMVGMIDRALDASDEKTIMVLGAATAMATRSVVSFGRAVSPLLPPALAVSYVVGSPLDVGMKLSGDPNWESLRAAMLYLRDNADALASFANHDPVMRRWLEWLIDQIKLHGSAIDDDAGGDGSRR